MKKILVALAVVFLTSAAAQAALKVTGQGDTLGIDVSEFPPKMQQAYGVMTEKCSRCHTIERIIVAVQSGVCPVTKGEFSKATVRNVVTRMYLKPESNISKREALSVVHLLNYLLDVRAGQPSTAGAEQAR